MASPFQPAGSEADLNPDSAPAPKSLFGAALMRFSRFLEYARRHTSNDLIFHHPADSGPPVQIFGADLVMVERAAIAWRELTPLLHGGLSDGSRAALERVGELLRKYRAMQTKDWPKVLSSLDGAQLHVDDVEHLAHLLDFIDGVARRNPIGAGPAPRVSPFNDLVMDRFQAISNELPENATVSEFMRPARRVWPNITALEVERCVMAMEIHAMRPGTLLGGHYE